LIRELRRKGAELIAMRVLIVDDNVDAADWGSHG
jgi:hypothetical protein